jgi:ATP-dependent Clp protease adaptor protein ClpS
MAEQETPSAGTGAPTAEPKPQKRPKTKPATKTDPKQDPKNKPRQLPPYHVVLLDDNDHTYEYVIEMLRCVFGYPEPKGYQLAKEVDSRGRVIVLTTHKEKAELKRDQILAYGTDYRIASCKGSMSAIIEPAGGT